MLQGPQPAALNQLQAQNRRQFMDILLQQIITGLVLGSMYALIALGYTMRAASSTLSTLRAWRGDDGRGP